MVLVVAEPLSLLEREGAPVDPGAFQDERPGGGVHLLARNVEDGEPTDGTRPEAALPIEVSSEALVPREAVVDVVRQEVV